MKKGRYIGVTNALILEIAGKDEEVAVLEAGCGSASRFDFGYHSNVTGIDISFDQLCKNGALDMKVLGDIETAVFKARSFDVIVCCEVLEHVKRPEMALVNFCEMVKDGGMIILMVPNAVSLKGLITKFTPYSFHHWVYRRIYKYTADPFPTYLRMSISPKALIKFANDNKLNIKWTEFGVGWLEKLRNQSLVIYSIYIILGLISKALSFGTIKIRETDFIIVYSKD